MRTVEDQMIFHRSEYPWMTITKGRLLTLRVDVIARIRGLKVVFGDPFNFLPGTKIPDLEISSMTAIEKIGEITRYQITLPIKTRKLRYHFEAEFEDHQKVFVLESGIFSDVTEAEIRPFYIPFIFDEELTQRLSYKRNDIYYQVFPDRFCNPQRNDYETFIPTSENYYGGTFDGLISKLDYIKNLGCTGIYLNPIMKSNSNHGYDILDYSSVNERFGGKEGLLRLTREIHSRNMKIMMDGVFNHCGWEHPFWQDVLEKKEKSQYKDWFIVYDYCRLNSKNKKDYPPELFKSDPPFEAFAFAANMPKWNTENDEVIDYLTGTAVDLTREFHIDSWRLDVPDEISRKFLRVFRDRMKELNPNIYIIGEIWHKNDLWVRERLFDGTMDYPLYYTIRDFAMTGQDDLKTFYQRVKDILLSETEEVFSNNFAFCSNHDIPRAFSVCSEDERRFNLSYLLIAFLGGNLSVYYGDEISMDGGNDPDCRRPMNWNLVSPERIKLMKTLIGIKQRISDSELTCLECERGKMRIVRRGKSGEYHLVLKNSEKEISVLSPDHVIISIPYQQSFLSAELSTILH
jgi:cyclomaltodextrinase